MTGFEKRLERLVASLPKPQQKMTFVYADGERVEVVGFIAACRQNTRRDGLVDVLGANEGVKDFLMCSNTDIKKLFSEEGAAIGRTDRADHDLCEDQPTACPAVLDHPKGRHPLRTGRREAVRKPARRGKHRWGRGRR